MRTCQAAQLPTANSSVNCTSSFDSSVNRALRSCKPSFRMPPAMDPILAQVYGHEPGNEGVFDVRTWGPSGAAAAIRHTQAVACLARTSRCGVDEAGEIVGNHLSRRRFLIGAGATAATLGMSGVLADSADASTRSTASTRPAIRDRAKPQVVIVGAGIAGLGCAYELWRQHGIKRRGLRVQHRPWWTDPGPSGVTSTTISSSRSTPSS